MSEPEHIEKAARAIYDANRQGSAWPDWNETFPGNTDADRDRFRRLARAAVAAADEARGLTGREWRVRSESNPEPTTERKR